MKFINWKNIRESNAPAYICLLLLTLVGLWPISSGIFSLKNDNIIYFLPYRFNIAEMIRSGHLPLWSPYVYMGFPIANDMQSGAWNPLVWLLALIRRYDLTSLSIELLIYFFLASVGMFKLARSLGFRKMVCFTVAVSYMFSGYMMDSAQILCWTACAAVLPFTWLYFNQLLANPSTASAVKFALANCLLMAGGYPAFFIINCYLLIFLTAGIAVWQIKRADYTRFRQTIFWLVVSGLLFTLTGMVMWLAFLDLLPHFRRGNGIGLDDVLDHSFRSRYLFSAIWPFALTWGKPAFSHGVEIFGNVYFGILLIPFALLGITFRRSLRFMVILALTLVCLFCSLGHELPFRKFAFDYLPLMNTFRHPANFRLFAILGLLLLVARGLQHYLESSLIFKKSLIIQFSLLFLMLTGLSIYFFKPEGFSQIWRLNITEIFSALKNGSLFAETMVANSVFQLICVGAAIFALFRNKFEWICLISVCNLLILAQPQTFYSIVSRSSPKFWNRQVTNSPAGFPAPDLSTPVGLVRPGEEIRDGVFRCLGTFYLKRPLINNSFNNPTILNEYIDFLRDSALLRQLSSHPFIFVADTTYDLPEQGTRIKSTKVARNSSMADRLGTNMQIRNFEPNRISFDAKLSHAATIAVFQNNYPGWEAKINGKETAIKTVNHTFIGLELPAGKHDIILTYKPWWLWPGVISTITGLIVCLWLLVREQRRRS